MRWFWFIPSTFEVQWGLVNRKLSRLTLKFQLKRPLIQGAKTYKYWLSYLLGYYAFGGLVNRNLSGIGIKFRIKSPQNSG